MFEKVQNIVDNFDPNERVVVFPGDCLDLLRNCPDETFGLIVTSPPYNIGKEYEKRLKLDKYIAQQAEVIQECVRCLSQRGSICWQVGNYVDGGTIIPLDTMLYPVFTKLGLRMRADISLNTVCIAPNVFWWWETIMWFYQVGKIFSTWILYGSLNIGEKHRSESG